MSIENEIDEFGDCNEVARLLCIKSQSVRARLWRTGTLWGVVPHKAPNRRNLFRLAEIRALITVRGMPDDSAQAA
jgi:hypothetical protein